MKCCSLVSASLGKGWTDLDDSFFKMYIIIRIRFLLKKKKKNWKSCSENSEKTESAFLYRNGWTDFAIFFKCS
jgi:hypothetical protein